MATGLFHSRDGRRATHRRGATKFNNQSNFFKKRAEGQARKRRNDEAKVTALRWELSGLLANGMNLSEAATRLGISRSYSQKLFAMTREELGVPVKD